MIISIFASKYYKKTTKILKFIRLSIKLWLRSVIFGYNNRKPLG